MKKTNALSKQDEVNLNSITAPIKDSNYAVTTSNAIDLATHYKEQDANKPDGNFRILSNYEAIDFTNETHRSTSHQENSSKSELVDKQYPIRNNSHPSTRPMYALLLLGILVTITMIILIALEVSTASVSPIIYLVLGLLLGLVMILISLFPVLSQYTKSKPQPELSEEQSKKRSKLSYIILGSTIVLATVFALLLSFN